MKIGLFGFGAGPAMIPLIEYEAVFRYKWVSKGEFLDILSLGYSLPGPISLKLAGVIGYKVAKIPGFIVSVISISLPALSLIMILLSLYIKFKDHERVIAVFQAVRPVIIALLFYTAINLIPKQNSSFPQFLIGLITFILILLYKIPPVYFIIIAAIIGFLLF